MAQNSIIHWYITSRIHGLMTISFYDKSTIAYQLSRGFNGSNPYLMVKSHLDPIKQWYHCVTQVGYSFSDNQPSCVICCPSPRFDSAKRCPGILPPVLCAPRGSGTRLVSTHFRRQGVGNSRRGPASPGPQGEPQIKTTKLILLGSLQLR
jgi:hypothetical protein